MTTTIVLSNNGFEGKYTESALIKIEENGKLVKKTISIDELRATINENYIKDNEMLRIGKIPPNYYDGYMKYNEGKFSCRVIFVLPRKKRCIEYSNQLWWIPFPTLVFKFYVSNNFLIKSKLFATKGEICDDKLLYFFPLGNVYDTGEICWGNVKFPQIHTIWDLNTIIDLFFRSPSNDELFIKPKTINDLEEFLKLLQSKKTFPQKFLVSKNLMFKNLLNE